MWSVKMGVALEVMSYRWQCTVVDEDEMEMMVDDDGAGMVFRF